MGAGIPPIAVTEGGIGAGIPPIRATPCFSEIPVKTTKIASANPRKLFFIRLSSRRVCVF
jgi:hypothetical protein